jgi:hypothetical protein
MDYTEERLYYLDHVAFCYHEGHYTGRGIMSWEPQKGFHIEAFVDRQGARIEQLDYGKPGVVPRTEITSIRMNPEGGCWAVSPRVSLLRCLRLIDERPKLSVDVSRVIFREPDRYPGDSWSGTAFLATENELNLPGCVSEVTRIGDHVIRRREH